MGDVKRRLRVCRENSSAVSLVFLRLEHLIGLKCSVSTCRKSLGGFVMRSACMASVHSVSALRSHTLSLWLDAYRFDALVCIDTSRVYVSGDYS